MKEIKSESELSQLKAADRTLVLFYASWCPFSQRFLPVFEEYSRKDSKGCEFVKIDDKPDLCDKYSVEFYPSVLCFEKGALIKRIDSKPGVGLDKKQFEKFVNFP